MSNYAFTRVFLIFRGSRLGKNFKINKTQRHKPQSKSRHHTGKSHKQHDYRNVYKEPCFTTSVLHRHSKFNPTKNFSFFFSFPFPLLTNPNANTKCPKRQEIKKEPFLYATRAMSYKAKRCIPQTLSSVKEEKGKRGKRKIFF